LQLHDKVSCLSGIKTKSCAALCVVITKKESTEPVAYAFSNFFALITYQDKDHNGPRNFVFNLPAYPLFGPSDPPRSKVLHLKPQTTSPLVPTFPTTHSHSTSGDNEPIHQQLLGMVIEVDKNLTTIHETVKIMRRTLETVLQQPQPSRRTKKRQGDETDENPQERKKKKQDQDNNKTSKHKNESETVKETKGYTKKARKEQGTSKRKKNVEGAKKSITDADDEVSQKHEKEVEVSDINIHTQDEHSKNQLKQVAPEEGKSTVRARDDIEDDWAAGWDKENQEWEEKELLKNKTNEVTEASSKPVLVKLRHNPPIPLSKVMVATVGKEEEEAQEKELGGSDEDEEHEEVVANMEEDE